MKNSILKENAKTKKRLKEEYNNQVAQMHKAESDLFIAILNDLKQNGKIVLYTNLMNSTASEINDMTVGISFPKGLTPFGKTIL